MIKVNQTELFLDPRPTTTMLLCVNVRLQMETHFVQPPAGALTPELNSAIISTCYIVISHLFSCVRPSQNMCDSFLSIGCFSLTLTTAVKVGLSNRMIRRQTCFMLFMMNVLVQRILGILDKEVWEMIFDTCCTIIAMCLSDK